MKSINLIGRDMHKRHVTRYILPPRDTLDYFRLGLQVVQIILLIVLIVMVGNRNPEPARQPGSRLHGIDGNYLELQKELLAENKRDILQLVNGFQSSNRDSFIALEKSIYQMISEQIDERLLQMGFAEKITPTPAEKETSSLTAVEKKEPVSVPESAPAPEPDVFIEEETPVTELEIDENGIIKIKADKKKIKGSRTDDPALAYAVKACKNAKMDDWGICIKNAKKEYREGQDLAELWDMITDSSWKKYKAEKDLAE